MIVQYIYKHMRKDGNPVLKTCGFIFYLIACDHNRCISLMLNLEPAVECTFIGKIMCDFKRKYFISMETLSITIHCVYI